MYSKSETLLIKRFLFSKKSDGYVSIFSLFSVVGISLGVAAIIIVMSVMNGFRSNLTQRLLGINSHINIYSNTSQLSLEDILAIKKSLNENNYKNEDCIIIVRMFLSKSKKILKLRSEYEKNKNIDLTITSARPPIFWKEKEITKQQIFNWNTKSIKNLIYKLNNIELLVKKNILIFMIIYFIKFFCYF